MKTTVSILFLCFCLTMQGQDMLRYEPYNNGNAPQQQTSYITRMTGYQYDMATKKLTKVPIKIQIIEGQYNDSYKFVAYYMSSYGWSQNFIGGSPTIYKVSRSDDLHEYFDYWVTTPIGKIYFNLD